MTGALAGSKPWWGGGLCERSLASAGCPLWARSVTQGAYWECLSPARQHLNLVMTLGPHTVSFDRAVCGAPILVLGAVPLWGDEVKCRTGSTRPTLVGATSRKRTAESARSLDHLLRRRPSRSSERFPESAFHLDEWGRVWQRWRRPSRARSGQAGQGGTCATTTGTNSKDPSE